MDKVIKVAMLTGYHPYEVTGFQDMLSSLTELKIYPQNIEDFVLDTPENQSSYSVIAFYNFHQEIPKRPKNYLAELTQTIMPKLQNDGKGFVFLHHALTAFPKSEYWSTFCGLDPERSVGPPDGKTDQLIKVKIKDNAHPITVSMPDWEITDEIYIWDDAAQECNILLETNHPESMGTLAWTKNQGNSRVFSFQLGHDPLAYGNKNFQIVLSRGIKWVCHAI